jgi:hypothetical protein
MASDQRGSPLSYFKSPELKPPTPAQQDEIVLSNVLGSPVLVIKGGKKLRASDGKPLTDLTRDDMIALLDDLLQPQP